MTRRDAFSVRPRTNASTKRAFSAIELACASSLKLSDATRVDERHHRVNTVTRCSNLCSEISEVFIRITRGKRARGKSRACFTHIEFPAPHNLPRREHDAFFCKRVGIWCCKANCLTLNKPNPK